MLLCKTCCTALHIHSMQTGQVLAAAVASAADLAALETLRQHPINKQNYLHHALQL